MMAAAERHIHAETKIFFNVTQTNNHCKPVGCKHFTHFRQVISLQCTCIAKHVSSAFSPPTYTHMHTHTLSLAPHPPPQPLHRRLMQCLIVWEVPLSSLVGLQPLVRGRIRVTYGLPLCLSSHKEHRHRSVTHSSYWKNMSMGAAGWGDLLYNACVSMHDTSVYPRVSFISFPAQL